VLLLPERYAQVGHMTSRWFEALLAGCLPIIPAGVACWQSFVPRSLLAVKAQEVIERVEWLGGIAGGREHADLIAECLGFLDPFRLSRQVAVLTGVLESLTDADAWAASDTVGDARGGHGSYCTPSYIEIHRAACLLTIGKPKVAIKLYEQALPALPAVYQRDRAAALSRLAAAYVADGQVEQAATVAHAALPVARGAGSSRIVEEIKSVSAGLAPHRPLPVVAALLDDLDSGDR
jgi:hypothetical protein